MRKPFNGSFPITQGFGENPADYAKFGLKGHNGIDYGLPSGTPLVAAISGKIIEAADDPTGYGLYIKIENDQEGALTAHMQSFNVSVGQSVNEGDLIGHSDNTGNSTGAHLHYGYFKKPRDRSNGYAGYIDPSPYFTTSSPSTPPTPSIPPISSNDINRADLANKVINTLHQIGRLPTNTSEDYIKNDADKEKVIDAILQLNSDLTSNKERAGKWDLENNTLFGVSDSNQRTVDQMIAKAKELGFDKKAFVNDVLIPALKKAAGV